MINKITTIWSSYSDKEKFAVVFFPLFLALLPLIYNKFNENSNSKAIDENKAIIKEIIDSTISVINNKKLDDKFPNIINTDTALVSSIKMISENGKDVTLDFNTSVNFKHPYFKKTIHKYEIGEYSLSNSKVQKAIINSFEIFYNKFTENYKFENSKIIIEICGTADGVKVFSGSKYEGDLGEDLTIEYYSINEKIFKTQRLIKNKTLLTNEIYALLRGYVVKSSIENNFHNLNSPIILQTKTYKEIGPEFRSVSINLKLENVINLELMNF